MIQQKTEQANPTCANCPYFQSFNGGDRDRGRGYCQLFEKVAKANWEETQDCRNTAADLEATESQPETDPEVEYALALEEKLERDYQASQTPYSDIEVDSSSSALGILYRVWQGMKVIGTFYRSPVDGRWVAEPVGFRVRKRYPTANAAGAVIVKAWGMRHE